LVVSTYLFFRNYGAESLMLLIAMGGDALIVSVVKSLVQSPRPLNRLIIASGFSYPSGHTAGSLFFCSSIAFVAWQYWKTKRAHALMGTGLAAAVCIVGFSRVYLGVHWFSDVLALRCLGFPGCLLLF
jgi:undecaprenyl-diphosphatase